MEDALAYSLRAATEAQQWDVVRVLASELAARRLERTAPNVPTLEAERARREGRR